MPEGRARLLIEVTACPATSTRTPSPRITLSADPRSLRVLEGTGGIRRSTTDDRAGIEQNIDDEVLKVTAIEFRSTPSSGLPGRVEGDLERERAPRRSARAARRERGLTAAVTSRQSVGA